MNKFESFNNRIKKNLKKLKMAPPLVNNIAMRIYDRDIPEVPYIIEIFGKYGVVWEKGNKQEEDILSELQKENELIIRNSLEENLQLKQSHIIFKKRQKQILNDQYQKGENDLFECCIENGLKFQLNLTRYLDVGLFLDHRIVRAMATKELSKSQTLLNLFSYTCSFGVYGASKGAHTVNVDLSNTYLSWGKNNYELNQLNSSSHLFIKSDVFEFLKSDKNKYQVIVLDPPSFSVSKKKHILFDIQNNHTELIHLCMQRLTDDGILYFSTNLRTFKLNPELLEKFKIKDITKVTIPQDFRDQKIHQCFTLKN